MRSTLKEIVFDVIKNSNKITKTQIKNRVLDEAVRKNILTKEFVVAFGDIGWVFQDLRQNHQVIDCEKVAGQWYWYTT